MLYITKVVPVRLESWGRGHDGLVNCVRTDMSKSVSVSKTFVDLAANTIYLHKFAGHNALASAFVATHKDSSVILVLSAFPEPIICKMNPSKSNQAN